MEFFRNEFVVQVSRSFRWQSFLVISTRDGIRKMIDGLNKALEQPESELRPSYLTKDAPTPFWQAYVTHAFKKTDRNVLTFEVVPDLDKYHPWKQKNAAGLNLPTSIFLLVSMLLSITVGAAVLVFAVVSWMAG